MKAIKMLWYIMKKKKLCPIVGVRKDLEEKLEIAKQDCLAVCLGSFRIAWQCFSCIFWGGCVVVTFQLWQCIIHLSLQNTIQHCSQMFKVIFLCYLEAVCSPATWTGIGKDTIRLQSQAERIAAKPLRVLPSIADPVADSWWSRTFTSCWLLHAVGSACS